MPVRARISDYNHGEREPESILEPTSIKHRQVFMMTRARLTPNTDGWRFSSSLGQIGQQLIDILVWFVCPIPGVCRPELELQLQ